MSDSPNTQAPAHEAKAAPKPHVAQRPKRNLAWVWLIPLVAAAIGASIVWREWSSRGPEIEITFRSAAGIEQGKTQIRYRDVIIGSVTDIRLSPDRESVIVTAQLDKDAEGLANDKTRFWVVKPTIGVTGVSGLATLFSGSYIEADTDLKDAKPARTLSFVGLEQPPPITSDRPGSTFQLRSRTLGSIEMGTPIYFLRIRAGVVTRYELDPNGKHVDIEVFVDSPYDKYVSGNTRFWNESGIQVGIGTNGLEVQIGSLASLLSSGISFGSFGSVGSVTAPSELASDHVFRLFESHEAAKRLPQGPAVPVVMQFGQSTRGLEPGATIDFHGLHIGVVDSVELDIDTNSKAFFTRVKATLYPAMLGAAYDHFKIQNRDLNTLAKQIQFAIDLGMRAQLQQANLITGGVYINLINQPGPHTIPPFDGKLPIEIPTIPAQTLEDIQRQVADIIAHIDKIPFQQISEDLTQTLEEISKLGRNLNQTLVPELSDALIKVQTTLDEINPLLSSSNEIPGQVSQSVQELDEVLRTARQLIDELRERPNALLFGEPARSYSRETLGVENR